MQRLAPLLVVVAIAACTATGGQGDQLPDAEQSINTARIDLGGVAPSFDLRYVDELSPREDTVAAPPDLVWGLLPSAYQELNVPLTAINPEARILGTNGAPVKGSLGTESTSRYFHCGRTLTGDIANRYRVVVTAMTQVREIEGREDAALVVSVMDAFAEPRGASSGPVRCSSTHRLESQIVDTIELELAKTGNLEG